MSTPEAYGGSVQLPASHYSADTTRADSNSLPLTLSRGWSANLAHLSRSFIRALLDVFTITLAVLFVISGPLALVVFFAMLVFCKF